MKIKFTKEQLLKRKFHYDNQSYCGLVHYKYGFYIHRNKFPITINKIIDLAYEKGYKDGVNNIYRKVMKALD